MVELTECHIYKQLSWLLLPGNASYFLYPPKNVTDGNTTTTEWRLPGTGSGRSVEDKPQHCPNAALMTYMFYSTIKRRHGRCYFLYCYGNAMAIIGEEQNDNHWTYCPADIHVQFTTNNRKERASDEGPLLRLLLPEAPPAMSYEPRRIILRYHEEYTYLWYQGSTSTFCIIRRTINEKMENRALWPIYECQTTIETNLL